MADRPDPAWDAELEAATALRSRVRAALETEAEPREEIDAAILAAARRAVGSGPRQPRRGGFAAWRTPLAAAAVVVIAASLTLLFHPEDERPAAPAPATSPPVMARDDAQAPQAAAPEAVAKAEDLRAEKGGIGLQEAVRRPVGALAGSRSRASPDAKQASGRTEVATADRDAAPAEVVAPPPATPSSEPAPAAETPAVEAAAARPGGADPSQSKESWQERDMRELTVKDLRQAESADAAAKPAPAAPAATTAFPAEARRLAKARKADAAPASASAVPADPALGAIAALWRAGRQDEAREALRRWRCEHPQAVLPADFPVPLSVGPACGLLPAQEPLQEDR